MASVILTAEKQMQIKDLYENTGKSIDIISLELDVPYNAVRVFCKKAGFKRKVPIEKNPGFNSTKMADDIVKNIHSDYRKGLSYYEMQKKHQLTHSQILHIVEKLPTGQRNRNKTVYAKYGCNESYALTKCQEDMQNIRQNIKDNLGKTVEIFFYKSKKIPHTQRFKITAVYRNLFTVKDIKSGLDTSFMFSEIYCNMINIKGC